MAYLCPNANKQVKPFPIMKTSFEQLIQSEKPVLIDFYATWCGPCHAMAPVLEKVAKRLGDRVRIVKIDVDKNEALSAQLGIRSVPTFAVYQNGKLLWRQAGMQTEDQLVRALGV
jgi:thioredoxin 1